jgi:hypothetical protein
MKAMNGFLTGSKRKYFVVMVLGLLLISAPGFAGNLPYKPVHQNSAGINLHPSSEWVLDKTVSGVDFYHSIIVCNGKNVVFLKFVNRNRSTVKVGWNEIFITRAGQQVHGFSGRKEMVLSTGITTPGECSDAANKKTIIRGSEVDPMSVIEIVNFEYKEITVARQ